MEFLDQMRNYVCTLRIGVRELIMNRRQTSKLKSPAVAAGIKINITA